MKIVKEMTAKDKTFETTQSETQREKRLKKATEFPRTVRFLQKA